MIKTTRKQRETLLRKWKMLDAATRPTYRAFRKSVAGTIGCDGAVVVNWCGMWLCIEKDGYSHT